MRRFSGFLGDLSSDARWAFASRNDPQAQLTWAPDLLGTARIAIQWPTQYQWAPSARWVEPLRRGFASLIEVNSTPIPQPYPGIVLIRLLVDGAETAVALDYHDKSTIHERCVEEVAAYFKMQHSEDGYSWPHVYAGGFVPGDCSVLGRLSHLRARRQEDQFRYAVYGRFGTEFASEIRRRTVEILTTQTAFSYEGGLKKLRYRKYLEEIAAAQICIDLPGNGDFCFRLIDYLAIGSCIIGIRPKNQLHVPLEDGKHIVYVEDDLSDLVDLCVHYLESPEEREALRKNSRDFFDRYLHPRQLAAYYLDKCLGSRGSWSVPRAGSRGTR
jgi:hypothetical protein